MIRRFILLFCGTEAICFACHLKFDIGTFQKQYCLQLHVPVRLAVVCIATRSGNPNVYTLASKILMELRIPLRNQHVFPEDL